MNKIAALFMCLVMTAGPFPVCDWEELPEREAEWFFDSPPFMAVPILNYHAFTRTPQGAGSIWKYINRFRADMEAILAAGFTPITFDNLIGYVYGQFNMPEMPVIITIDDGYLNNYTLAFPVLVELEIPATIFLIGWSRGRTTQLDGVTRINPHFSWEQAVYMRNSGLIDFQSHTYDMHRTRADGFGRHLVLRNPNETFEDYFEAVRADDERLQTLFTEHFGERATVFAYPHWLANTYSEAVFRALGYRVTLFNVGGVSVVEHANPESLFGLNRINVTNEMNADTLVRTMLNLSRQAEERF